MCAGRADLRRDVSGLDGVHAGRHEPEHRGGYRLRHAGHGRRGEGRQARGRHRHHLQPQGWFKNIIRLFMLLFIGAVLDAGIGAVSLRVSLMARVPHENKTPPTTKT